MRVRVQFLGTGTPLGQAGRLQACILLSTDDTRVLLDCGMTSLVALARAHVEPASLDAIVISHLHGDHFGGLPLVLLERALRQEAGGPGRKLQIAGPAGTAERVRQSLEVLGWSESWTAAERSGLVEFVDLRDREPLLVGRAEVTAYSVPHAAWTAPTALLVSLGGKTIAYSGDSGWTDTLVELAAGADVFICGVWSFDTPDPMFLDYQTLRQQRDRLMCERLILTHLGPTVLDHPGQLTEDHFEIAEDGLAIEF
jgi:ribonuclease BN (tRNA processing enzyme)